MKLKQRFDKLAADYIAAFIKKQDIDFDYWIGDEIGGLAQFIDQYYFTLDVIRFDIDTDQPKGLILQWQDDAVDNAMAEKHPEINYKAYSQGLRFKPC